MRHLARVFATILLCAAAAAVAHATAQAPAEPIQYVLRMPAPANHLFEVAITAASTDGTPVDFQMPAWSPGRYVIYDFARNVQEVTAADSAGRALGIVKLDKQTWRVTPVEPGPIVFSYRVFANDVSGTFSQLDARHGDVNGASVYMYVVGRKPAPVRLTVEPPPRWKIANGSAATFDQTTFDFANYDLLIDTPCDIAPDFEVRTFQVDGCEYRVVTHQLGGDRDSPDRYASDVERIVRAENAVMGVPPDLHRYTFLVHFAPGIDGGDGMEHLTSTQIVMTSGLGESRAYGLLLGVTAHEFFHVWNVKRLRPVELGPWDYTRENYTTSLWIAEGLTSYYGELSLARAGLYTEKQFLDSLASEVNNLQNRPGRFLMSLAESSFDTWLDLAVRPRQQTNVARTSISYYNKGEIVGALLDLEIRHRTNGARSLDDVFRLMWKRFYLDEPAATYYYKGRGYRGEDFLAAVNEVSGSDFGPFFAKYVTGVEEIDYDTVLGYAGLQLERERRVSSYDYGVKIENRNSRLRLSEVESDGLAALSGLRRGDVLLRIDGAPATPRAARELFEKGSLTPTPVRIVRDGDEIDLTVVEIPSTVVYEIEPRADATPEQRALRRAWLGQPQAAGA